MKIKSEINFKKMEINSEPLSPDNANEESNLKNTHKNNDSDESINKTKNTNTNDLLRYLERSKSFTSLIDAEIFSKNMEKTIQNYNVESLMYKLNNLGRLKKVFNEDTFLEFLLNTSSDEILETDFNTIKDALEDFNTCCLKINK